MRLLRGIGVEVVPLPPDGGRSDPYRTLSELRSNDVEPPLPGGPG